MPESQTAPNFVRFDRENWFDEIRLIGDSGLPVVRLITVYRYKTSGMSGDEWRTSTMWQTTLPMQDAEPSERTPGWLNYDGPWLNVDVALAAAYPGIYKSQQPFHNTPIHRVEFMRKGKESYRSTFDGEARPLLTICGHLPWALVGANDHPVGTDVMYEHCNARCFQPGCSEVAVSTYRLKSRFDYAGRASTAERKRGDVIIYDARRFCPLHLRRGDAGMEDCDANYTVISGPGPADAVGWRQYESRAKTVML